MIYDSHLDTPSELLRQRNIGIDFRNPWSHSILLMRSRGNPIRRNHMKCPAYISSITFANSS